MLNPAQPRPLAHRIWSLVFVAVLVVTCAVTCLPPVAEGASAQPATAPIPFRASDDPWLIRDDARLFNEDQMSRFQFDLRRLQGLGENVMVYTRRADASRRESEGFAKRVREAWNLESAPDADDGLLMLITVNDTAPADSSFVVSSGSNFFPLNQMEKADFDRVYETEIEPNFREERYDVALAYGVRRLLYAADYMPPDPPALTGVNAFARQVAEIGGAVLLQAAVLGLAIVPAIKERRLTTRPSRKTVLAYVSMFGPAGGLTALFAIVGRSGLGMAMALLILMLVGLVMLFFLASAVGARPGHRRVPVPSTQGRTPRRILNRLHQRRGQYVPQP